MRTIGVIHLFDDFRRSIEDSSKYLHRQIKSLVRNIAKGS